MFVHHVFFWMKDDLTSDAFKKFENGIKTLPAIELVKFGEGGKPEMNLSCLANFWNKKSSALGGLNFLFRVNQIFAVLSFLSLSLQQPPPFLQHPFLSLQTFLPSCANETPLTNKTAVANMKIFFIIIFFEINLYKYKPVSLNTITRNC